MKANKTKGKPMQIWSDESGRFTDFKVPFAALHYDQHYVRLKDQDKIDDAIDGLIELHYSLCES